MFKIDDPAVIDMANEMKAQHVEAFALLRLFVDGDADEETNDRAWTLIERAEQNGRRFRDMARLLVAQ